MTKDYSLEDAVNAYNWLGHEGWTELVAASADYRLGKENFDHNVKHKAFPLVWYARDQENFEAFSQKHAGDRLVMLSINDRPHIYKNAKGYPRSALEKEIEKSQNILFDFDPLNKGMSEEQHRMQGKSFANFAKRQAYEYFRDLGINLPVGADSGNGYWFLFAHPPVFVQECPDIVARNRQFAKDFKDEFRLELENLELRLDDPGPLRRLIKVPGTTKPETPDRISKFYGTRRVEDEKLRDLLLNMAIQNDASVPASGNGGLRLNIGTEFPSSLEDLIKEHQELHDLWLGKGKPSVSDTSRSGYEFAFVRKAIELGYVDVHGLATALAVRPGGCVKEGGKGLPYIHRTIANAMTKALVN